MQAALMLEYMKHAMGKRDEKSAVALWGLSK
jgi:hypothetical protein